MSSSVLALPKIIVLKSAFNEKYLTKKRKEEASTQPDVPESFLSFDGEDYTSPFAKFEVHTAKNNSAYVHIRCFLTKKYLVRLPIGWIVAAADQPEEDIKRASCTLFQPIQADDFPEKGHFRFLHVQSGFYTLLMRSDQPATWAGLFAQWKVMDADHCDVYKVLDWESLVIFPKTVAFKFNKSDRYLALRWQETYPYLQFVSADQGDRTVENEIFTFGDGYVRIRSVSTGKFWRRSPNWIWADSSDTIGKDANTLFWPIKITDNVVALRNMGNNRFCKSLTDEGKTECLNAAASSITDEGKLTVEEYMISRSVYDLVFFPEEGSVYDLQVIDVAEAQAENYSNSEDSVSLKFAKKNIVSTTIGGSVSLKIGVKTTLEIAAIPFIVEGKIELSSDLIVAVQWGTTETTDKSTEVTYTAHVPPMTRTIVTMVATQGACHLPFSYTQRTTLKDGTIEIKKLNDGIYKGINRFGFKFNSRHEKLSRIKYSNEI